MSVLDNIQIEVAARRPLVTGNALPLLYEIKHGLQHLSDTGEPTILDLRAIPFGPGDEERLLSVLGAGEVSATINVLGESTVKETGFPAVWLVEHKNSDNERIALQIEITEVPAILKTQPGDLADSLTHLNDTLCDFEDEDGAIS